VARHRVSAPGQRRFARGSAAPDPDKQGSTSHGPHDNRWRRRCHRLHSRRQLLKGAVGSLFRHGRAYRLRGTFGACWSAFSEDVKRGLQLAAMAMRRRRATGPNRSADRGIAGVARGCVLALEQRLPALQDDSSDAQWASSWTAWTPLSRATHWKRRSCTFRGRHGGQDFESAGGYAPHRHLVRCWG